MAAPPGYDPTVSILPDPGAAAVPMKAMMGGAREFTTVTILGEPFRIRIDVKFPLQKEEISLLNFFMIEPEIQERLGNDALIAFFHALTHYNCEKEEGVLLNPKCEPVRNVLRAALMKGFLDDMERIRANKNLGPLRELFDEEPLFKRRNHLNKEKPPLPTAPALDRILNSMGDLKERYKMNEAVDLRFI